ncbi:hypothetical protein JL720_16428 [Aureococcus anophagefferens]|nr:hypothetical protein JL720_16428 [Aureococcus anophagefferens]
MPSPASLFVFGDLNYRSNPALDLSVGVVTPQSAQRCVDAGDYAMPSAADELRRELDDGRSLATFASPPCRFPPTFKVAKKRGFFYLNSRLPSYTDRILYAPDGRRSRRRSTTRRRRLHVRPQAAWAA